MPKKIVFRYILSIVFLMVLTVAFSACNNMSGVSRPNNNKGNVYLKVDVASVGRTALPDFPNVNSISDFTFILTGKGPGSGTFTPLTDDPTNNPDGEFAGLTALTTASFPIQTGEWSFKLTASKEGTVLSSEEVSETIGSGENSLSFNLKWEDTNLDATKTGSLSFELDFSVAPNKEDVKLVTAELVNTTTNTTTCSSTVILDRSSSPSTYKATYSSSTLPALANLSAGTYRIILKLFTVDSSANSNVLINTWTELAIITGGQESTGSRTIDTLNEVYSITWNLDGGTSTDTFPECYTRLSDTYTLPDSTKISKTGYTFGGWFANEGCTGDPVTSIQKGTTGIQNLYAKWIARDDIKYYIYSYFQPLDGSKDLDDYQEDSSLAPRSYKIGTTGHATNETADLIEGFESQPITQETIAPDESTIVKIYYDRKSYSVTFVPNGNISIEDQTVLYQGTATEPSPAPSRSPYTFEGWYTSTDGGTTLSSTAYDFTTSVTADITLYAKWTPPSGIPTGFVYVIGGTVTGAITNSTIFTAYGGSKTIPNMYVCDHEVTQAEYETYCKYKDSSTGPQSSYGDGDNYATYDTNWYDAIVYCNIRSIKEGLSPVYKISGSYNPADWPNIDSSGTGEEIKYSGPTISSGTHDTDWDAVVCNPNATGYRLPTSAEWEYIARGGENGIPETQYDYSGSDRIEDVAWYRGNSESKIHEVKTRAPNSLGIYDMSGNVMEWCWDADYSGMRELRGGHYSQAADSCTVYNSGYNDPGVCIRGGGFRVIRYIPVGTKLHPTEVGDIVFNDGSATLYTNGLNLTAEQKQAAIAIIFYKGTNCNNEGETDERLLGVGLVHNYDTALSSEDAKIMTYDVTSTYYCNVSGSVGSYEFSGKRNGSQNFADIQYVLNAYGKDDTAEEGNYPGFNWAINYKNNLLGSETESRIISGTDFTDGWYIPSTAELYELYKVVNTVNPASVYCLGDTFEGTSPNTYVTSSKYPDTNENHTCSTIEFATGTWNGISWNIAKYICAIRQFN